MTDYEKNIRSRGFLRYWLGFFARLLPWMKIQRKLRKMRQAGATIGIHVGISSNIVPPASKNIKIGDHVSIQTDRIDVRAPLTVGDYVILGDSASIITCSHDIDDPEWKFKPYGLQLFVCKGADEGFWRREHKGVTEIVVEPMDLAAKNAEVAKSSVVLAADKPSVLKVEPGNWFCVKQDGNAEVMVFSDCKVGEFKDDDFRRPYE